MNLKRKLWWAQHRTDVYKYGTILSLVLIVTISIIYFTYSKFSSSNEMTMYETTVEPFIKNDYFIASYIDGEWSNEIPGKNDGYIVDKIVCDNGATGTWDNEEWGINIRNATKKIKCGVYFKKLVKLTEQITTLASTDTTNFASDDPDSNIRYIGTNANSYVYFNCSDYSNQSDSTCEKWHIIGVFKNITKADGTKEDLVKLRRNEALPYDYISFDNYGSSNYSNNWETSSIKQMLNDSYYNSLTAKNIYDRDDIVEETIIDFSSSGLKNNQTRNSIESIVWNLGGVPNTNLLPSDFYSYERGSLTYGNNPVIWTGKIALPYISDYLYSVGDNSTSTRSQCLNIKHDEWFYPSYCAYNAMVFWKSWYLDISSISGIHVPRIGGSSLVFYEVGSGMTEPGAIPVLYLKSDITILKGDGSETNPYQLNLQ